MIEENVVRSLMDYRRAFPGRATVQFFFMNGKMKPLVMFWNVTCVVRCCLNLDDDTDGADGPVQQTPVERKRKTATRVFDIFTWRFLRNEKKNGQGMQCLVSNLRKSSTRKLLYHIYTDVKNPASFSSPWKLYKAAKKVDSSITLMQVEHFLESQRSYTLHRHFNSRFRRRKVLAHGVRYQFQADLIDYAPLKRDNRGMTFLLSVIRRVLALCNARPHKEQAGRYCAGCVGQGVRSHGNPTKVANGQREGILQSPRSTAAEREVGPSFLNRTGCESTDSGTFQQDGEGGHQALHDSHD